jgi:tetrahydromethanopterin S-methyltransferase subunit F
MNSNFITIVVGVALGIVLAFMLLGVILPYLY